jgi:glycine/D-amino acid oxidase-like deaminating enzyme
MFHLGADEHRWTYPIQRTSTQLRGHFGVIEVDQWGIGPGMKAESLWIDTGPAQESRPPLEEDVRAEVAVLGGGIAGITTALLLVEAGAEAVLLEAGRLAQGVSGYTTAKVTSQHGAIYSRLRSKHGANVARTYGQANEAALGWIAERIEGDGIECDFRRQPAYLYTSEASSRGKLEKEAEAAVDACLPASLVEETPLPYGRRRRPLRRPSRVPHPQVLAGSG